MGAQPTKQILYDKVGNIATIATYNNFKNHDGLNFPDIIQIDRPQEEYSIQLGVVKMTLNQPLTDAQFDLPQPAGTQVVDLDKGKAAANAQQETTTR
jgi:hypothetical protein